MGTPTDIIFGFGGIAPDPKEETNTAKGLTDAGSDFGALLLGIGNAVAATQQKLTETSAETTSVLATTLVELIAVQETFYDDNGNVRASKSFTQKLPLINFIDPVFYEYPQVRFQARFEVNSFATATSSESQADSQASAGGLKLSLSPRAFGLSAAAGFSQGSQSISSSANAAQATAVGQVRMFAQISPRSDIGVPQPTQVITGPGLNIIVGPLSEILDTDGKTLIGRTIAIDVLLVGKNGQAITTGKPVSIETDGTPWDYVGTSFTDVPPDQVGQAPVRVPASDSDGYFKILVKRSLAAPPAGAPALDITPKPLVVSARLGLVTNSVTVTL